MNMRVFYSIFGIIGTIFFVIGITFTFNSIGQTDSDPSSWIIGGVFSFIGLVFGCIGFFGIRSEVLKARTKQELFIEQRGKQLRNLKATVRVNTRFSVNNVNPFLIDAAWTDPLTKTNYIFTSENIWGDPSGYIKDGGIDVYLDESNFKRYYVDITFLPAK